MSEIPGRTKDDSISVLLISPHDWFSSALRAVLEPDGFVFRLVRDARTALRDVETVTPELVIIGEGVPDMDPARLAGTLRAGSLRDSVPILIYSPNFWHEEEQARAVASGAWDIIREPVRPRLIQAKLRRLLEIKRLIELTEDCSLADGATGLYNLAGLLRVTRLLEAAALRNRVPLACAVMGIDAEPGAEPATDSDAERDARRDRGRHVTSQVVRGAVRDSDAIGWINDTDLGIVAYNTDSVGVTTMVRRLNHTLAESRPGIPARISAGIVEFAPPEDRSSGVAGRSDRIASLTRFAAARTALRQARDGGGGIRIAEVP